MSEETHRSICTEEKYIDPRTGKERTRFKVTYVRTEAVQRQAELDRLGPEISMKSPTSSDRVLPHLETPRLLWITSSESAKVVIRTRLENHRDRHRLLTATDLLRYYLEGKEGVFFSDLMSGFPEVPQLFLCVGYFEARNKYIGDLLVQIAGQRHHSNQFLWMFMPLDLPNMVAKWGPSVVDLGYYTQVALPDLPESAGLPSPEVTVSRMEESQRPREQFYNRETGASLQPPNSFLGGQPKSPFGNPNPLPLPSLGETVDPKFIRGKKRKGGR